MTAETTVGRWQREDGWPSDAYFDAVDKAVQAAGIDIADGWRDDDCDFTLQLGDGVAARLGYAKVFVSWRVGEESEPLRGEWDALHSGIAGWYWVPYSDEQKALGDFAKEFDVPLLAEPEQVAKAVAGLVNGSAS